MEVKKSFLTVNDVATILNIAEKTIRKYIWLKAIPYYKIGGLVRFDPAKINEWIKENEVPTFDQIERRSR